MKTDVETGCIVPAAQGLILGFFAGVFCWALAMYFGWDNAVFFALLGGGAASFFTMSSGVILWRRSELDTGYYPPPPPTPIETPAPQRGRVEVSETDGAARKTQMADLDTSPEKLRKLAEGILYGNAPFSEAAWTGQGRPFSKNEFIDLRTEFIKRQWAKWRNPEAPAQGAELTGPGRAVLRTFASETVRPTGGNR